MNSKQNKEKIIKQKGLLKLNILDTKLLIKSIETTLYVRIRTIPITYNKYIIAKYFANQLILSVSKFKFQE